MSIDTSRLGTDTAVTYTTVAGLSAAFGAQTRQIRINATSACHILISESPTAQVNVDALLPANWVEYITVTPGQKISVVRSATNGLLTATSGTLYITQVT